MQRHIVNFGLLFSFVTLATTGAMAFLLPFSIVTTRVHIVFGLTTAILVGLHLATRVPYFKKQLMPRGKANIPQPLLLAIAGAWVGLLATAVAGWAPAELLVEQGYEARHSAQIVRGSPLAGFGSTDHESRLVVRKPAEEGDVAISLYVGFEKTNGPLPAFAVWAETPTGSMIETLYLDPALAYSSEPDWGGRATPRHHILPLWRHRYTLVSGVDPTGEVDAVTSATPSHSFTLDDYLTLGEGKAFILCVEVNAPRDPNGQYPDEHVGQPSLLYTAYVEPDADNPYALLELTGHGGGAEQSGAIQYDLDGFTSARQLVDLLLLKTEPCSSALAQADAAE